VRARALQCVRIVTLAFPIAALVLTAHPPLAMVVLAEHMPVPGAVGLESSPFERKVTVLLSPKASPAAVARKLARDSRICPTLETGPSSLVLHCRTERLRASLGTGGQVPVLDLYELSVPSWRPGDEGPPLATFDTEALGLGRCPGQEPAARGECALAAGDPAAARRHFLEASRQGSPLAELRLGDLALAADDPLGAVGHWRKAGGAHPWNRLVALRLCELEPGCVGGPMESALYETVGAPSTLRADVVLRRARLAALRGQLAAAAVELGGEHGPTGACRSAPAWCRHVLALALRLPVPDGTLALGVYLDTPHRLEGPDALELAELAAEQAGAAGAPVWAANLLASLTGRVPAARQGPHLLRVVQLYVEGGDRARAEEVLRFARTRLPRAEIGSPGWVAASRALRARPGATTPGTSPDPDLAAARAVLDSARLASLRKGTAP
jgi:hypothetical protein